MTWKNKYTKSLLHQFALAVITGIISGCTSPITAISETVLQIMGLTKSGIPDEQKPPHPIHLQLQAGVNLNADEKQRAQAAVVRIYHLKETSSFWLAPYAAFIEPDRDRAVLGSHLVAVQEITLAPGQSYDVIDKVPRLAKYLGIVTLFYSPAAQRWRIAFDVEKSQKDGILVGIHSCAMTAARGASLPLKRRGRHRWPSPNGAAWRPSPVLPSADRAIQRTTGYTLSYTFKVLWGEGLFLRPQHFQRQDAYHESRLHHAALALHPY